MFGLIKTLFAGPDAATKMVSGLAAVLDDNVWSKEERGAFITKLYETTTGSALARRMIALMVVGTFCIGCFICFYGITQEKTWYDNMYEFMHEVLKEPTGYIVAFYFLVRALGALKK